MCAYMPACLLLFASSLLVMQSVLHCPCPSMLLFMLLGLHLQSEWGKTMALVAGAGSEDTPLQEKLADLAAAIGKIGFGVAVACFIALLIKWCVRGCSILCSRASLFGVAAAVTWFWQCRSAVHIICAPGHVWYLA